MVLDKSLCVASESTFDYTNSVGSILHKFFNAFLTSIVVYCIIVTKSWICTSISRGMLIFLVRRYFFESVNSNELRAVEEQAFKVKRPGSLQVDLLVDLPRTIRQTSGV